MRLTDRFTQFPQRNENFQHQRVAPEAEIHVSLLDMVLCLTRGIELLHPAASEHHLRVACIASAFAQESGLPPKSIQDTMIVRSAHRTGWSCLTMR